MSTSNERNLRIGVGSVDITPQKTLPMQGFAVRKGLSTGVYQPIYAKAMALDDGQNQIVIICADLALWGNKNIASIREALQQQFGLTPAQIIFNVTHTHCGPIIHDEEYAQSLVAKTIDLVGNCLQSKVECKLFFGRGSAEMGVSRRGKSRDGSIFWGLNPYGPVDREVVVLKAVDMQGKTVAVVANYACHPSTISGYLIGGDYAGFVTETLQNEFPGATAFFIQGAGGDVKPNRSKADNPRLFDYDGGPEAPKAMGKKISDAVLAVLAQPMQEVSGAVESKLDVVQLPLFIRPIDADTPTKFQGRTRRLARYAKLMLESMDENGNYLQTKPCEVYVVKIGPDFLLVGLNGEICVRIGLRIKAQLLPKMALVAGYTGLHIGYVPSMDMIPEQGYETGVPYSLEVEDFLVDKVIELVEE